jgi:hypothetical protein
MSLSGLDRYLEYAWCGCGGGDAQTCDPSAPEPDDRPACEMCQSHLDEADLIRYAPGEAYCKPCDQAIDDHEEKRLGIR